MHELSLAVSIVDIANGEAEKNKIKHFTGIEIVVGTLSGVVAEALILALKEAVTGSSLERAEIKLIQVDAEAKCENCQHVFPINDLYDICPQCNSFQKNITKGKEFEIKTLSFATNT